MESLVSFPELDGFVMDSQTLPRVLEGELVDLDVELFRGEGDAIDAVADLHGPFRVESAEVRFSSAYGRMRGTQRLTLRSANENSPSWRNLDRA